MVRLVNLVGAEDENDFHEVKWENDFNEYKRDNKEEEKQPSPV